MGKFFSSIIRERERERERENQNSHKVLVVKWAGWGIIASESFGDQRGCEKEAKWRFFRSWV